MHTQKYKNHI